MQVIETFWQKPITIRLQNGLDHTFLCIEDSLDFLENEWPIKAGRHQCRAIDLCRSAVNRITSTEVAHEALISACIEAGMPPVITVQSPRSHNRLAPGLQ